MTAFFTVMTTIGLQGQMYYADAFNACAIHKLPRLMPFLWIPAGIFETVVFTITVGKVYRGFKITRSIGSDLFLVMYRDGFAYYLVIILLRGANILSWLFLPGSYGFAGLFILFSVMSVSMTRLQLNLMKTAHPPL
ncbi:hypothetical protein FRC17_000957, partial [Serendipita sp. 399]